MFLYSKLIADRTRTCIHPNNGAFLAILEDREFLRVITSQNGCYLQITFTIEKHTQYSALDSLLLLGAYSNVFIYGRGTENRTLINRLKAYYFSR